MRFFALFFCALFAFSDARAATLEERLVTLFKEFCLAPQNWSYLPVHGDKLAATRGWKARDVGEADGHITMIDPKYFLRKAWDFDESGATSAIAGYSMIGSDLPGVRQNGCFVSLKADHHDNEKFKALRKAVPTEIERQFGSKIILRDSRKIPFSPGDIQWQFTVPGQDEPDCARRIVFPRNYSYSYSGNEIALTFAEIAYPNDKNWGPMHRMTWCFYDEMANKKKQEQK